MSWATKEKAKTYRSRYYLENQEKILAYQREYRISHKEEYLKYCRAHRSRINANLKRYRDENPDRAKGYMLKRYGITFEQWNSMLVEQGNACAICKNEFVSRKQVQVDHCHVTGTTRKLLCSKCNMLVGFLEGPEQLLNTARAYIIAFHSGVTRG